MSDKIVLDHSVSIKISVFPSQITTKINNNNNNSKKIIAIRR